MLGKDCRKRVPDTCSWLRIVAETVGWTRRSSSPSPTPRRTRPWSPSLSNRSHTNICRLIDRCKGRLLQRQLDSLMARQNFYNDSLIHWWQAVLRIHDIWCGSGSGSADPCLWLMDPIPAIFIIDLHDTNQKLIFLFIFLHITFWRYIYIILKSQKEVTKQ